MAHRKWIVGVAMIALSVTSIAFAAEKGRRPKAGAEFDILGASRDAVWVNAERSMVTEPFTGVQYRVTGRSVDGPDTMWMVERSTRPYGAQTFKPTGTMTWFNGPSGVGLFERRAREYAVKAPYMVGTSWMGPRWDAPGMLSGVVGDCRYTITQDMPMYWEGQRYEGAVVHESGKGVERDHWWLEGLGHVLVISSRGDTLLIRTHETMGKAQPIGTPGRY